MRLSHHFGSTLKQPPSGTEAVSHQLLVRAGFIRQLGQGLFSYLPLAHRSMTKITSILREEMDAIGGQELSMPVVHPAELWKATGRWDSIGPELARFQDRRDRDMVLAMTHEEVVADLCRTEITSYRQLPQLVYQIQTKFRDDPRPRAGLIRVREFVMKDSYSLDRDEAGLDKQYRAHYRAYFNIFNRCALPTIAVGSDVGMMGGSLAHEYMYLTGVGEDTLVLCDDCGYAANRQIARFAKPDVPGDALLATERVATPGMTSIEDVARFLDLPVTGLAKVVFMVGTIAGGDADRPKLIAAVVRGDMQVNETKLTNVVRASELRPATEAEIAEAGAVPGYASPIGLSGATVVVDDAVAGSTNLVTGANEEGIHLRNVNPSRDFGETLTADIVAAGDGDACVRCGQPLRTSRGVEVGNIFKLGTRYSTASQATYVDADGTAHPVIMGSYGIGVGRLLACIAEEHHDSRGLRWPVTVAPFEAHLVALGSGSPGVRETAERVYRELNENGIDVLYDDRDERPGVQFADADLIGAPLRLTVSARSLECHGVEVKRRDQESTQIVGMDQLVGHLRQMLERLNNEVSAQVVPVELPL
jgi:prolyl-tRNA synthetase